MLNYTCAKCNKELQCIENEVWLIHYTNNDERQGLDAARCGDLYECPVCHCQIVLGLGDEIFVDDLIDIERFLKVRKKEGILIEVKR